MQAIDFPLGQPFHAEGDPFGFIYFRVLTPPAKPPQPDLLQVYVMVFENPEAPPSLAPCWINPEWIATPAELHGPDEQPTVF
jgi:hypothetical protein